MVEWSANDDVFVASSPEFSDVSAIGINRVVAIRRLEAIIDVLMQVVTDSFTQPGKALGGDNNDD